MNVFTGVAGKLIGIAPIIVARLLLGRQLHFLDGLVNGPDSSRLLEAAGSCWLLEGRDHLG